MACVWKHAANCRLASMAITSPFEDVLRKLDWVLARCIRDDRSLQIGSWLGGSPLPSLTSVLFLLRMEAAYRISFLALLPFRPGVVVLGVGMGDGLTRPQLSAVSTNQEMNLSVSSLFWTHLLDRKSGAIWNGLRSLRVGLL